MIVSVNPHPSPDEFKNLMENTDSILNSDALKRPQYYASRGGSLLEDDVVNALIESSKGTAFENTIEKISGQRFPDIIAAKFYGVEVKSTKDNHWTSTGSSILETTRINGIERIYMTFGKLGGNPIEFLSKPYEQCLYGIAVTHMPRYLINMQLNEGDTIFEKMGISYDELRKMDNPITPVAQYYRSLLKDGESLWWTGDRTDEAVSPKIRLWKNVDSKEKLFYTIYGCVNYPEVFAGNYDRYSLWLTTQGIVDSHIRDQFSAGGKEEMLLSSGEEVKLPGVFRRVKENYTLFLKRIAQEDPRELAGKQIHDLDIINGRIKEWSETVSKHAQIDYSLSMDALQTFFWRNEDMNRPWWRSIIL